ncbi:MAG: hypothetical protein SFU86_06465 [Pirellulaceae bacterium]|nr:hypothetical protein [Pirellulaceae bacterium]
MPNFTSEYQPVSEPTTSADVERSAAGPRIAAWQSLVANAEAWIVEHPGASLASAFAIGATLAWWIKRT